MAEQDPYASIAKPLPQQDSADPYASIAKSSDVQGGPPTVSGMKSLGIGALKGIDSTISGADDFARKHLPAFMTNTGMGFGKPADLEAQKAAQKPANDIESLGKGAEQAGEFLLPGMGEEKIGAAAGKFAPLAKIGYNAATTGGLNKLQGGSFGTGAIAGGLGGAVSEGLASAAPKLAESSIGITKFDRGYGRDIGHGIINDTTGIRPSTITGSAQSKIDELTPQLTALDAASDARGGRVSLASSRNQLANTIAGHEGNRAMETADEIRPIQNFLNRDKLTGLPLAENQTATGARRLKRGLSADYIGKFNPDQPAAQRGAAQGAYGLINQSLHDLVPESAPIDQRISSLIPVVKRAESTDRSAPLIQRTAGRIGAQTGALTGAALGATEGRREGGLPGMVVGGATGLMLPELLATPEGRMIAARTMASPAARNLLGAPIKGAALQLNRKDQQ